MESRAGGTGGDAERLGNLHQRQPDVVVQNEDGPLIERDAAKRPFQLVAVRQGAARIRARRVSDVENPDVCRELPAPTGFVVAGVDEDSMDPRLEVLRLPQVRDPAPGEHESVLQRVLGQTRVAQDPVSHRVELIADLVHQDGERLTIAPTGLLDEVSIHHRPPVAAPGGADYQL